MQYIVLSLIAALLLEEMQLCLFHLEVRHLYRRRITFKHALCTCILFLTLLSCNSQWVVKMHLSQHYNIVLKIQHQNACPHQLCIHHPKVVQYLPSHCLDFMMNKIFLLVSCLQHILKDLGVQVSSRGKWI